MSIGNDVSVLAGALFRVLEKADARESINLCADLGMNLEASPLTPLDAIKNALVVLANNRVDVMGLVNAETHRNQHSFH